MNVYDGGSYTSWGFTEADARLAGMHGYRPAMAINLRPPKPGQRLLPEGYARAVAMAFRTVRREVWRDRESRLRATWESYG